MRTWFKDRGITIASAYATADVGLIAYESTQLANGMILDENIIVEIVEPNGTKPVTMGETGEVVVTIFDKDYPLIRFGTGDLSAIDTNSLLHPSPCGRTNLRIKGWLGRADQTTKIKGMFVHPGQVQEILKKHPQISKARVVVSGNIGAENMAFDCELHDFKNANTDLNNAIIQSVRDITKLRASVNFRATNTLPNDGKLIEDARSYE